MSTYINPPRLKPTADDIKDARRKAGITQTVAANLLHTTCRVWQQWEAGDRKMHPAFYDLFLRRSKELKIGEV